MDAMLSKENFYSLLKERFFEVLKDNHLLAEQVKLTTRALSPEEAIGITERKDFPILTGKDVMVQAECAGSFGQAFTDAPAVFHGTLKDVCELDFDANPHNRGIFIASLNAVMGALGRAKGTVHCRNDGPERCAPDAAAYIKAHYGAPKIALIGYQPSLLERLSKEFELRVTDLNPDNIGAERYSVLVEDGANPEVWQGMCAWADLILCTGSTICNGSIVNFLPYKDKMLFFGTTLAGAAELMGLKRLCFADKYPKN